MVSDIFGIWTKDIRAWLSVLHHWLQHTGTSWTLPHCTLFYMPLKDKYETDCYQDFFPNLILGSASVSLPSLVCFSLWDDLYISSCCCCWMHLTVQWAVYFVWVVFKIGRGESCSAIDHLLRVQIWRVREQVTQKKLCFADVAASEFALEFEQGECINWNCTYQDQKLICPENQNETVSRACDTSFMKKKPVISLFLFDSFFIIIVTIKTFFYHLCSKGVKAAYMGDIPLYSHRTLWNKVGCEGLTNHGQLGLQSDICSPESKHHWRKGNLLQSLYV